MQGKLTKVNENSADVQKVHGINCGCTESLGKVTPDPADARRVYKR